MNLKKAKRLRKIIHAMTVGKPWAEYLFVLRPVWGPPESVTLTKECGRYHYQRAKKHWKRSKHA